MEARANPFLFYQGIVVLPCLFIGCVNELNTLLREQVFKLPLWLNPSADSGTGDDHLWRGFDKLGDILTREPVATPAVPGFIDAPTRVDDEVRGVVPPVDDERAE